VPRAYQRSLDQHEAAQFAAADAVDILAKAADQVSPIRSRTVLFQASNLLRSTISKLLMRRALSSATRFWDRHSAGCELVKVPGDHMSIMTAPAIGIIAERLRKEMNGERYAASA
jgi:thioesterase domain-containing protein